MSEHVTSPRGGSKSPTESDDALLQSQLQVLKLQSELVQQRDVAAGLRKELDTSTARIQELKQHLAEASNDNQSFQTIVKYVAVAGHVSRWRSRTQIRGMLRKLVHALAPLVDAERRAMNEDREVEHVGWDDGVGRVGQLPRSEIGRWVARGKHLSALPGEVVETERERSRSQMARRKATRASRPKGSRLRAAELRKKKKKQAEPVHVHLARLMEHLKDLPASLGVALSVVLEQKDTWKQLVQHFFDENARLKAQMKDLREQKRRMEEVLDKLQTGLEQSRAAERRASEDKHAAETRLEEAQREVRHLKADQRKLRRRLMNVQDDLRKARSDIRRGRVDGYDDADDDEDDDDDDDGDGGEGGRARGGVDMRRRSSLLLAKSVYTSPVARPHKLPILRSSSQQDSRQQQQQQRVYTPRDLLRSIQAPREPPSRKSPRRPPHSARVHRPPKPNGRGAGAARSPRKRRSVLAAGEEYGHVSSAVAATYKLTPVRKVPEREKAQIKSPFG